MQQQRLPVIPEAVLKAHKVNEFGDTRFRAAARLLQAIWREEKDFPIGSHRNAKGRRRKLGSRLDHGTGMAGSNFLTPEIAKLARRETIYREVGAMVDEERLWTNLLSSQPLCFNLFGAMKLDMEKANRFFRDLLPDYVDRIEGIYFEHSPGRGDPIYTEDHSAFDVFVPCVTFAGKRGFIAIEVKYSETMAEPLANLRPRYDELSNAAQVFRDPEAQALRAAPLQQLWREHLLSRAMVANGSYDEGRFLVIYPAQNINCATAVKYYRRHLASADADVSGFQSHTLEECLSILAAVGGDETARAIHERYLDFGKVEQAIFG